MSLRSPIARVKIADETFLSGDGKLRYVAVTLGEDQRSNNCRFEVFDRDLKLANKFFAISFEQGGIVVPQELLGPKAATPSAVVAPGTTASSTSAADGSEPPEIRAWLDTIAYAEGTSGPKGYNTIFTGATFEGYSKHPRILKCSGSLCSDASGRYQFLSTTYAGLNLPDFSPASQDKGAVKLLKNRGAYDNALKGEAGFDAVCDRISYEWASIPPYRYAGQGQYTKAGLLKVYRQNLAKYKGQNAGQAIAQQPPIEDKATSETVSEVEVSVKGTEIIIELGYSLDQLTAYHFIHTGTSTQGRQLDSTVFEGQSVRWLMTRRTKNSAYSNITLRALAERVCSQYGLALEMEGTGPTYAFLDQTGITDYELLLREARAIGYSVQDSGIKLILRPWRPKFTGFVITQDILQSISFSDKASGDRQPVAGVQQTTSTPSVPAADAKTKIDRLTGGIVQTKVENSKGSGIGALLGSGAGSGLGVALTGAAIKPVTGTPTNDSAKTPVSGIALPPTDAATGLPKQEIGSIDLADGRAEATAIQDESRRVKGYESQATILTTPEALAIAPGSIIGIAKPVAGETFAREWRVSAVQHTLQGGKMRTALQFYTPQAAKAAASAPVQESSVVQTTASTQGFAEPMVLAGNSSCGPICEFGHARGRLHAGLDYGGYGVSSDPDAVLASHDGIVTYADWVPGNGAGRLVVIKRSDGWVTRYMHLLKIDVKAGQQVKQGTRIATRGGSGFDRDGAYAIHLHFEIRNPSDQPINPRDLLPKPGLTMA